MRKIQLLFAFIILSIYINVEIPVLCKHWHELKKPVDYPLHEMVDKHQMEPDEKLIYTQKRQKIYRERKKHHYQIKKAHKTNTNTGMKVEYFSCFDFNGNELWSIPFKGYYLFERDATASNGISLVGEYGGNSSLVWLDLHGNV